MPQTVTEKRLTALRKLERDLVDLDRPDKVQHLLWIYDKYADPEAEVKKTLSKRRKRIETEISNLKKKLGG